MAQAKELFNKIAFSEMYNFQKARVRVPSGFNIEAWRRYLEDYEDKKIVDFLEFGWPMSFNR